MLDVVEFARIGLTVPMLKLKVNGETLEISNCHFTIGTKVNRTILRRMKIASKSVILVEENGMM